MTLSPVYRVHWHKDIYHDIPQLNRDFANGLIGKTDSLLTKVPNLIGRALRGTSHRLWNIKYGKFRVIYTINEGAKEVWVLAIRSQAVVYRDRAALELVKLAVALQEKMKHSQ